MERILLLGHAETGSQLGASFLEALAAAKQLQSKLPGAELCVGLVGSSAQQAANLVATAGIGKFYAVAGSDFDVSRYSTDAAAAEALGKATQATIILAPATTRWSRCMAGVAHRLGGCADTHVAQVSGDGGKVSVQRWYYRQRMEATLTRPQRPWVLILDPGNYPAAVPAPGTAAVELVEVTPSTKTSFVGYHEPAGDAKTVKPDAELLLVAGAGWTKKQSDGQVHAKAAEEIIGTALRVARASLGSTKSLVDLGGEGQQVLPFLTHLNQVGQTGSTPRHKKGLATCCHGEEPHTVGWRFITERRAINLDPNCGWARGKADILYVADAFAVMRKVNELLAK